MFDKLKYNLFKFRIIIDLFFYRSVSFLPEFSQILFSANFNYLKLQYLKKSDLDLDIIAYYFFYENLSLDKSILMLDLIKGKKINFKEYLFNSRNFSPFIVAFLQNNNGLCFFLKKRGFSQIEFIVKNKKINILKDFILESEKFHPVIKSFKKELPEFIPDILKRVYYDYQFKMTANIDIHWLLRLNIKEKKYIFERILILTAISSIKNEDKDTLRLCFRKGKLKKDFTTLRGNNLFHLAVLHSAPLNMIKHLINIKIPSDQKNKSGLTPIAMSSDPEVRNFLMSHHSENYKFIPSPYFFSTPIIPPTKNKELKEIVSLNNKNVLKSFYSNFFKEEEVNIPLLNITYIIKKIRPDIDDQLLLPLLNGSKIKKNMDFKISESSINFLKQILSPYNDKRIVKIFNNERICYVLNIENLEFTLKNIVNFKLDPILICGRKPKSLSLILSSLNISAEKRKQKKIELKQDEISFMHGEKIGDYTVIVPETNHDLIDYGDFLNNCIGNSVYSKNVLNKLSFIIALLKDGKVYACLEFNKDKGLIQFKGFQNSIVKLNMLEELKLLQLIDI
tara:strand:- start:7532 stop:9223 length:1692 start_codon:yes stop_codon:yes gene_type:complete